jgi:hypothetical protein
VSRRRDATRRQRPRLLVAAGDVARVVLVDVELAVEPEEVRVGAEEALDVGVRRQQLEALVLERAEVLAPDLRPLLEGREVHALADPGLAETAADLEHARDSLAPSRKRL